MTSFTRILVDIDATAGTHPAFDRAIELARQCGARVKLVDVVTVPASARPYLPGDAERMLAETRRANLALLASRVQGLPIDVDVLSGRPAQAIIAEVVAGGFDLVVRSHARDLAAQPRALGAIDMQLFRACPCTVWAVGPGAQRAPKKIVAAVNPNPHEAEEQRLNARIVDIARLMAGAGDLILFQAWHAFGADMLRSRYSPEEMADYIGAAQGAAKTALDDFVRTIQLPGTARVELREGTPEDTLPAFVVSEGIDLVVMGTVARTGITGMIMGNTAERLLQRLTCSVMAVKPEGFTAPGA
jgi:nucleotide-binding universal stress UspA family protein